MHEYMLSLCVYMSSAYICIYVLYTSIYVYVYICKYVYMYICILVYMYICIYVLSVWQYNLIPTTRVTTRKPPQNSAP